MTFKTLAPPAKSNKQVREYVEAVEKGLDSYFVVQNGKGWYVRKASTKIGNGTLFATKIEAIQNAKAKAAKKNSEIIIFNNKGTLLTREAASPAR
jgi:hypothetical protein